MLYIVMGSIIVILIIINLRYCYAISSFQKQLTYKMKSQSRFTVSSSVKHKEILALQNTLNLLFEELFNYKLENDKKDKQMQMMLSSITHDIRTPLTSIQGYMTLLKETENEQEKERYVKIIEYRLQMLHMMLETMFMDAKLNDDDYQIDLIQVSPYPILCKVLASFYSEFTEKKMTPSILFENQQMMVLGNEELLTRVFQNLIHNALQHGTDYLKIIQKADKIMFANGIQSQDVVDVNRVFDRFFMKDISRSNGSSGLGLSISKKIMEKLQDNIFVEQNQEECSFCLMFANQQH